MTARPIIIVPAYNEEACILETVRSLGEAGYDYIVINDGSTDGTLDVCERNGLNVLNLPCNLGIGGAVQAGHMYALEHGYDVDVQFDGDGQHDAGYISNLLDSIAAGNDLAVGSRYVKGHEAAFRSTFMRRVGIRWLSGLISLVSTAKVADVTSGFRACGKKAMRLYAQNYPTDYPEPESIVMAERAGLKIAEIPVEMHERAGGKSSIRLFSTVYYMIKVTLAILISSSKKKQVGGIS